MALTEERGSRRPLCLVFRPPHLHRGKELVPGNLAERLHIWALARHHRREGHEVDDPQAEIAVPGFLHAAPPARVKQVCLADLEPVNAYVLGFARASLRCRSPSVYTASSGPITLNVSAAATSRVGYGRISADTAPV